MFAKNLRIVRVEMNQSNEHVSPQEAFFPPEQDTVLPQDIHFVKLAVFSYDDRNGLLTAIGFGEGAKKRTEEYVSQNHEAQKMGFESAAEAQKYE